ncbi:hypothetical protein WR25_20375 [Diploscapter pachys]|uniref:Transcription elongation factor SPT5 n=1 Tax=Diploscapter pachys TaxID=2018661 RepID=A0A2A2KUI5_9BILA|nr:hypothetical protein WR25_20375 [Diploscapter pachys]
MSDSDDLGSLRLCDDLESESESDSEKDFAELERKLTLGRKRKIQVSSSSDEEKSSSDGDEEEGEKSTKARQKKRRPRGSVRNEFILEDVEVDDDDEEESEDDGWGEIEKNEKHEAEMEMFRLDAQRRQRHSALQELSEDELVRRLEDKYSRRSPRRGIDDDDIGMDSIAQTSLLPQTRDPNLWIVKCRLGEEKAASLQLMRKFIACQNHDQPLLIKSVVCKENLKGMIYVEAHKQAHVQKAIEGVSALNSYIITVSHPAFF